MIEVHILGLHWMIKRLALSMSVKPEGLFGNIQLAKVFHYPVLA